MKIGKTGATRCQIKLNFRCGSIPDPTGGAYSDPPDHLAVFNMAYIYGEGRGGVRGGEGKG